MKIIIIDLEKSRAEVISGSIRDCLGSSSVGGVHFERVPETLNSTESESDLVFIHASPRQGEWKTFLENVWVDKPAILYSGNSNDIDTSGLPACQIRYERNVLHGDEIDHLCAFLKEFERMETVSNVNWEYLKNILHGLDPRLEATTNLLHMFLPLHIELQIGDMKELSKSIVELDQQLDVIPNLIKAIMGLDVSLEDGKLKVWDDSGCLGLLNRLLEHISEVKRFLKPGDREFIGERAGRQELDRIFGFVVENGEKRMETENGEGFHRTYEKLRDKLFEIEMES